MWTTMKDWFNLRFGLDEYFEERVRSLRVPKNINILYTLGVLTAIAYAVQAFTGIVLLVYYVPHPDHAFRSVQDIMTKVPYGWLFREMHAVGSNLMITVGALHMITVFMMGNYKRPRELTWVGGGLSLMFTVLFGQKLKGMGLDSVLVITDNLDDNLLLASRNLPNVLLVEAQQADPVSLVRFPKVLMTKGAVAKMEEILA